MNKARIIRRRFWSRFLTRRRPLRFLISTLFLADCQRYLCAVPERGERMVIVTGPVTRDGLRVPSRMEVLPLSHQSRAYVKTENAATARRVLELDEDHGHKLLMMKHSHIMYGAKSTRPSDIDIRNQLRFAAMGWEAIGCIFSLDGYVRFFDPTRDFTVEIFGKDFELVEEGPRCKVIRLTALGAGKQESAVEAIA